VENLTDVIIENEKLIYKIINKYKNHFEIEDLYQVAVMGLIKASQNYNSSNGTKFTSYAYPFILGEVIKYINEYRSIKVSKEYKKMYYKIIKASELLSQKLMKTPSNYELSLFLEMEESLIEEIMMSNQIVDSLDKIIGQDGQNLEMYNKFGYCDSLVENYSLLSEIEKLSPLEQNIIQARYYEDMSQSEVGKNLGMYQVEVSRKEKKILQKLKDNIAV
jgi:RNA polymerase sporulation-specific sigma factor